MTTKYIRKALALLLLGTALVLAGCGGNGDRDDGTRAQNVNPGQDGMNLGNDGTVASHLEQLARSVNGVKDANCVVMGNMAIVGIDVDPKMERSRVGTLKYAVAEAFRKDPYGVNAVVTADLDINERLREIGADIRGGRPVAGFAEELADIVGRIMPQIPWDPPAGAQ